MNSRNTLIADIVGREILDSRGNPTIEVDVELENGIIGRAAVPSGASTGENEAVELRDGDNRYGGKGVLKAVENVNNTIAGELTGFDALDQVGIDTHDDPARRHPEQGASWARMRFSASRWRSPRRRRSRSKLPLYHYIGGTNAKTLPVPMMNILNGGKHADNNVDLQEFMIVPVKRPVVRRSAPHGRRGLPRAEVRARARRGTTPRWATKAVSPRT